MLASLPALFLLQTGSARALDEELAALVARLALSGNLETAARALDARVQEFKVDSDAAFARARLDYGAGNFSQAEHEFDRLVRLQHSYALAWQYFANRRLGTVMRLPQAEPHSINSLLRGDVTRQEFVEAKMKVLTELAGQIEKKTYSESDVDFGNGTSGTLVITSEIGIDLEKERRECESEADFALAQIALAKRDDFNARRFLLSVLDINAADFIDVAIAKKQLSELK